MTVLGGLVVDGVGEVQLLDNDTGTHVEVGLDDLNKLLRSLFRGAVGVNVEGEGLSNTDGVGKLDKSTAGEAGGDKGLGDPAAEVGSGTVDLGVVLSGESTTTVGSPTTVGVDDDLAASETGITLGSTDDEQTRGLDVVHGLLVKVLGGDDTLDDLLEDLLAELLGGDVLGVLGRHNDGVDTERDDGTVVVGVLNGDLGLGVGTEPGELAAVTGLLHGAVELVGEEEGQGQELRGLVGGISEHDTLVTGTEVLKSLVVVKTLGNVGRLLLNGDEHVASLVVEALGRVIVANVLDGVTDGLLVVETGLCGDLAEDHDHTGLGGSLASNLGERVLAQTGIENGIGDLVAARGVSVGLCMLFVFRECGVGPAVCESQRGKRKGPHEEGADGQWEEGAFDDADNASDNDDDNDETTTRKSLTQSCRGDPHQPTRR